MQPIRTLLPVLALAMVPAPGAQAQTPASESAAHASAPLPRAQTPDAKGQERILFTAQQAEDSLEAVRGQARPLWQAGDPEGLRILEEAWSFVESTAVADLARGSREFRVRIFNLAIETACAHAIRADTAAALRAFKTIHERGAPPELAQAVDQICPDLHALREMPEYQHVLALWRSEARRGRSEVLATPYRDALDVDEAIAGLSLLWSRVATSLPNFQTAPGLDLDSLYLAYLPRVRRAETTYDYYRVLRRFTAELRDAHTNVYFPPELAQRKNARPPLRTLRVEDRVVVTDVLSPELEALGIGVGMEILQIDGIDVDEYAAREVIPYQSSSTPQDLLVRAYRYALLAGDVDRPVRLTLRDEAGNVRVVEVPRGGYASVRSAPHTTDTILAGGIGYLRIDGFDRTELDEYIPAAMDRLADTRGLIIDVRFNGGGNTIYGLRILDHLTGGPYAAWRSWAREHVGLYQARGLWPHTLDFGSYVRTPQASYHYSGPVVVLVSAMTFSAAEDFAVAFDALGRGVLMGEATGGSSGQPLGFALPGGGTARVRTKHDTYPDGTEFIGVGVQPHIVVRPTLQALRQGRDNVLDRALEEILRRVGEG